MCDLSAEDFVSGLSPGSVNVSSDLVVLVSALAVESSLSHSELEVGGSVAPRIDLRSLSDLVPLADEVSRCGVLNEELNSQLIEGRKCLRHCSTLKTGNFALVLSKAGICAEPLSISHSSIKVGRILVNAHHIVVGGNGVNFAVNAVGERHISNVSGIGADLLSSLLELADSPGTENHSSDLALCESGLAAFPVSCHRIFLVEGGISVDVKECAVNSVIRAACGEEVILFSKKLGVVIGVS